MLFSIVCCAGFAQQAKVVECSGFESTYSALLTDKSKSALDFISTVKNGVAFYYIGHSMAYMDVKVLSFDGNDVTCFKNGTEKKTLAIKAKERLNIIKLLDSFTEQKCYHSHFNKNEDLKVIAVIKDGVLLIRYLARGGLFPDKTSDSELNTLKELYEATAKFQYRDN
ncbi:hypothetical protein ACLI09_07700 [Flavobacterium sp. RHBU_24]|uniref:hypothetical protein n=1 Tax=Flavobacterium sp. RHBU_24 TaxID=3391185 RepID=UPI0039851BEE